MHGINWGDAATWAAVAVAAVGGSAALIQLRQQSNVLRGEAERNKRRDLLLDGQLLEIQQRQLLVERQQADKVDLARLTMPRDNTVELQLTNRSARPIRDVACATIADGQIVMRADLAAELHLIQPADGRPAFWHATPGEELDGWQIAVIRADGRVGFSFKKRAAELPGSVAVRFTDDAGLDWQLGEDLHLLKLDGPRDW